MKHVIIGNGPSGTEAAAAIRSLRQDDEITIIAKEPYSFYFRPKLVEYIANSETPDKLFFYKNDFFESKKINQMLSLSAVEIDRTNSSLILSDGKRIMYDRLLISCGSVPFIPDVKLTNSASVETLRTINDAEKIRNLIKCNDYFTISGGGLLGIETANSLIQCGKKVTIVEYMPYLLPKQTDAESAAYLHDKLKRKGINFIFSDSISGYDGKSVVLKSGTEFKTDVLIYSSGVRPDISLAERAGIPVARGVITDLRMRTDDDKIYASGDCAEAEGFICGLWMTAREQGRIAGLNMAGSDDVFVKQNPPAVLKITGIDFISAGNLNCSSSSVFRISNEDNYIRLNYSQKPECGIVIGNAKAVSDMRSVFAGKMMLHEFTEKYG